MRLLRCLAPRVVHLAPPYYNGYPPYLLIFDTLHVSVILTIGRIPRKSQAKYTARFFTTFKMTRDACRCR